VPFANCKSNSGNPTPWQNTVSGVSHARCIAINERQPEDLETQIDDDVDWVIYGPIELFPFLGARRGKAAVLEVCRQISENVRVHRSDRESIMLGEDTQANPPFSTRSADWCTTSTTGYSPRATLPEHCSAMARRSVCRSTAN
jgi:hypothetical protein